MQIPGTPGSGESFLVFFGAMWAAQHRCFGSSASLTHSPAPLLQAREAPVCAATSQNQGRGFIFFTAKLAVLAPFCSIGRVDEPACTAQGASVCRGH